MEWGRRCVAGWWAGETSGVRGAGLGRSVRRKRTSGRVGAKALVTGHPRSLAGQRDWMLRRLKVKPDLTLRAWVAELQARAIPASYGSVWRLLDDEGISFKKKPARKRTGPA